MIVSKIHGLTRLPMDKIIYVLYFLIKNSVSKCLISSISFVIVM